MSIKTPTQRFLRFDLEHNNTSANSFGYYEDFHYIDISQALSAINSRLYRQGRMYSVANITVHDYDGDTYIKFCPLPNTWPVHNAWKVGFRQWLEMNAQLPAESLSAAAKAAKWADYRVYYNDDHVTDIDKLVFTDVEGNNIRASEHNYSKYTSLDGGSPDEFTAHMMGEHSGSAGSFTSVCLLEAYEEILTQPTLTYEEADLATGVWTNLMEREGGFDDIADDLSDDYDNPPYDSQVFPGMIDGATNNAAAPWCARETHITTSASCISAVGGFEAPLGLIGIETATKTSHDNQNPNIIGIQIELVPGSYKGVHAPSMGDAKRTSKTTWKVD